MRIKKTLCRLSLLLLLLFAFGQTSGWAQSITGNILGTVTDPSGSVIPNASVTATNVTNGFVFNTTTNESGYYNLRFLPIGQYKVSVEAAGFGKQEYGPFSLEIAQDAKVNAVMKVASSTTSIEVNSDFIPLLNTENNVMGTTLDSNTIQSVALNGRNFSSLTLFLPGSVSTQPNGFRGSNGTERNTGSNGQASVNGNRMQTNNYYLDGIEINETINNLIGYNPSPDALEQMKVVSANAPAEYGNVNGGDMIMVTKSGTNSWHGSAFYFIENWRLDANTWAHKHTAGTPVARTHYTQPMFGGTIGGPIIKDKLFFFADYEGFRKPNAGQDFANVATAAMRSGDFSALGTQLYNNSNNATTGPVAYANNKITVANPAAIYLFAHPEVYPLPNNTATDGLIQNNYIGNTSGFNRNDQADLKIDWKPTQSDTFAVRYLQGEGSDMTIPALKIHFQGANSYPDKGIAINEVHVFSPELVNEFRAGFTRVRWVQGVPIDTTGVFKTSGDSLLGINAVQPYAGFASLEFNACGGGASCTNVVNPTNLGSRAGGQLLTDNTFQYGDTLTWLKGHHQFKMGFELTRYQQNNYYPGNNGANGYFQYYPTYTMNVAAGTPGYALADFELNAAGAMGQGGLDQNQKVTGGNGQRQWRTGYFFQDDWKPRPNLTLNLGVRYEYDQPIYEVNDKEANIDYTTKTIIYAGKNGHSRALYDPTYTNIMPRVGFNYSVNNKLVVRGGFGITAYLEGTGANLRLTYNPPYWNEVNGSSTSPTTTTSGSFFSVSNGFSAGSSPTLAGSTYRAWYKVKPSVINEWSMATEYAITPKTNLTVAYVGEQGQHLVQAVAGNQLTTPCRVNGVVNTSIYSAACIAADPSPFYNLVGQNGGVVQTSSEGTLSYNALQASLRQHLNDGLEYTVNYTWSHALTNSVGFFGVPGISGPSPYAQNAYDNAAEYGPAGMDVRHSVNGTAVYSLPFGHGKTYGGNWNHALDQIAGGWKIAASGVVYGGFPVTVSGDDNSATGARAARPNHYRKLHVVNRSIDHWFGTDASVTSCSAHGTDNGVCAYGNTAYGTFGNARPGTERAPGFQQYDFSAYKDLSIWNEHKLTLRADIFNAFNITSYGNPNNYYLSTDANNKNNFGQITDVRSVERQIQFAAKYSF